jgi:hypothetical protein
VEDDAVAECDVDVAHLEEALRALDCFARLQIGFC